MNTYNVVMNQTPPMRIPLRKRLFDILAVVFSLVVTIPLVCIVAILVRIRLGSPVLFTQTRAGHLGRPFTIYKFRTMQDATGAKLAPVYDSERLTPFGKVLRRTSLDELPQLWNVMKGDMSLVGPRPLLVQYLDRYTQEQAKRHCVLPGVTGWAQVNGRNAISWEDKFALDVWYVENWSLRLDLKILLMTIMIVFRKKGINTEDQATTTEFMGGGTPKPANEE
jgi:sugar transferase EpsL